MLQTNPPPMAPSQHDIVPQPAASPMPGPSGMADSPVAGPSHMIVEVSNEKKDITL